MTKNYRWRSLLIPKNIASIQIQKVAIFDSDRKKIKLIPNKQIVQILQPIIIDFLRRIRIKLIFQNSIFFN